MSPERKALLEVIERAPGAPVSYGIDRLGPWARIGEASVRARTPVLALTQALTKHIGATS